MRRGWRCQVTTLPVPPCPSLLSLPVPVLFAPPSVSPAVPPPPSSPCVVLEQAGHGRLQHVAPAPRLRKLCAHLAVHGLNGGLPPGGGWVGGGMGGGRRGR